MKRILCLLIILSVILSISLLIASPAMAAPPTFTGDVESDFTGPGVFTFIDPYGVDVGLPEDAPPGTISGNDMTDFRLAYDPATDTMYVGINTYGIAGDVDGDGNPGGTSAWLAALIGSDLADFGGSESFAVYFDLDLDGTYDVIAGVSSSTNIAGFSVNLFSGSPFLPSSAFGAALPGNTGTIFGSPDADDPDLEFTITNFSTLPGTDASPSFRVSAYVGSFADDGIGEDFISALPIISVTKTANPTSVSEPGGNVEFTITVSNDGVLPVTIDSLFDSTFDLDIQCSSAVGTLLDSGETYTCTFTEFIAGNAGDPPHENTATAVASDDDGNIDSDDDDATVTFTGVAPEPPSETLPFRGIVTWAPYLLSFGDEIVSHLFDRSSGGLTWSRSAGGQFVVNGNLPNLTQKSSDIIAAIMTIAHNGFVFLAQLSTLMPARE